MKNSGIPSIFLILFSLLVLLCVDSLFSQPQTNSYPWLAEFNPATSLQNRFQPPVGFQRILASPNSFGYWLRNLPLLPEGTPVKDYRSRIKVAPEDTILAAVVDYDIQGKKLEQCMDIIIRFRAEYLKSQKRVDEIAFYLPINYLLKWNDWKNGFRPIHRGSQINLLKNRSTDSSCNSFDEYLKEIFYHSNTQTAYFNYTRVQFEDIQIGDFIVKKGSHGHAVLILDVAIDSTGNKIALMGHGDTPARQFYILNYKKDEPWFPLNPTDKYPPLPIKKKMYWDGLRRFYLK